MFVVLQYLIIMTLLSHGYEFLFHTLEFCLRIMIFCLLILTFVTPKHNFPERLLFLWRETKFHMNRSGCEFFERS